MPVIFIGSPTQSLEAGMVNGNASNKTGMSRDPCKIRSDTFDICRVRKSGSAQKAPYGHLHQAPGARVRPVLHRHDFGALFPNFPNKRNSAGRIVTGYIIADLFEIELGEWGKYALHGQSQDSFVSLLYFASSRSKTLSAGIPGPLSLPS